MDKKMSQKAKRSPKKKRAYHKPRLVVYGDLGRITQADPAGDGEFDGTFVEPDNFYKTS